MMKTEPCSDFSGAAEIPKGFFHYDEPPEKVKCQNYDYYISNRYNQIETGILVHSSILNCKNR